MTRRQCAPASRATILLVFLPVAARTWFVAFGFNDDGGNPPLRLRFWLRLRVDARLPCRRFLGFLKTRPPSYLFDGITDVLVRHVGLQFTRRGFLALLEGALNIVVPYEEFQYQPVVVRLPNVCRELCEFDVWRRLLHLVSAKICQTAVSHLLSPQFQQSVFLLLDLHGERAPPVNSIGVPMIASSGRSR